MRRRPARRARNEAKPLLQVEPVHLVDHAVDVVAERGAVQLDGAVGLQHLLDRPAHLERRHGEAPACDRFEHAVVRIGRQFARLAPAPGEKAQGPRGRDRRIELAERACRGITRVREDLPAGLELPLVQLGKVGVRHVDFAAHLKDGGHVPALQLVRNLPDGPHICGHVLAFGPIAARRGHDKFATLVAQRHRQAVDLVLGGEVQRRVSRELQETPNPRDEFLDVLVAEHVSKRQHPD